MKIHEYQGKDILRKFGVPVPRGIAAFTVQEAVEAAQKLGGSVWVVKAQIHAGGRGKGGGVKVAKSIDEVKARAEEILGMQLVTHQTGPEGQKVRRLYIEEGADIQKEYYLSCVTDRGTQKVAFIASSEGGMDIEEVAHSHPEKIVKVFVDPATGLTDAQGEELARGVGMPDDSKAQFIDVCKKLYTCYMETDASLVEINPLNRDSQGNIIALDAKFNFDSNALFRHPEIVAYRDLDEEDPAEVEASKFDLSYISLDGNIGCLVNGAGLAMSTMDTIKLYGGEPANFLDVGGGATTEKVTEAFKIMLRNENVKAILVNIFGGIMQCDTIANGVVSASKAVGLSVPLVVRMKGTNEQEGKRILAESGLPIITADTMAEAAEKVVNAAKGVGVQAPAAAATAAAAVAAAPATTAAAAPVATPAAATPAAAKQEPESTAAGWGKWVFLAALAALALLMFKMCGKKDLPAPAPAPAASQVAAVAESASAPAAATAISLGDWLASVADGKLMLNGKVASQEAKDQLLAAAGAAFGADSVLDQLNIDNTLPAFQGSNALGELFAWLKTHAGVSLKAEGNRLAFAGPLGEALIGDLASKAQVWFGDSAVVDTSGLEAQVMKATDALQMGLKEFRINVEFDTGKATLRSSSKAELDDLAEALKAAGIAGEIAGYTDNTGNAQSNQELSQQRAEAVKAYLVERGVAADKLTAKGYGIENPIADNNTEQGRQRNRRVQFRAQ